MRRFDGRVVLVTGAAGGIGLATARAFADEGASVVLADRDRERVFAASEEIRDRGGEAMAVTVDVTDPESVFRMVAAAVDAYGVLQIAVNNAGIPSAIGGAFEDIDIDDWRRLIDTNLTGTFLCMRAEAPALRAAGGTAIVNTASIQSLVAAPGMPAYIASKHGVAGLTKAAALDLISSGIRVNAVAPGFIETPMLAPVIADPGIRSSLESTAPIGRIGSPDEVAQAILFLASDAAAYIVGSVLSVDGGLAVL